MITLFIAGHKGLAVLKALIDYRHLIDMVIYESDTHVLNDYSLDIVDVSKKHDIAIYDRNDNYDVNSEWGIAVGWRYLIHDDLKLIVLHDSLLSRYRGVSPLVSALINGDEEIGITALYGTQEYDSGDIIDNRKIKISYPITINTAILFISPLAAELALNIVCSISRGEDITGTSQDTNEITYSLWRDDDDYYINWSWSAAKIRRFIDAVGYPYKGAAIRVGVRTIRIYKCEEVGDVKIEDRQHHVGKVLFMYDGCHVVVCGEGLLKITDTSVPLHGFRIRFR